MKNLKHIPLLLIFALNSILIFVQPAKSQTSYIDNDKKTIEYLNANWKVVPDKRDAVFLRYVSFPERKEIFYSSKKRLESDSSTIIKSIDGIIILNGEYKWYDKKDRLMFHDKYENGERVWGKTYIWGIFGKRHKGKSIHEYFDYTKKYDNQPNTFYSEMYDKKGNKTMWYLRQGKKGYKYYSATE